MRGSCGKEWMAHADRLGGVQISPLAEGSLNRAVTFSKIERNPYEATRGKLNEVQEKDIP